MHLQENTLFDLDLGVKVTQNVPSTLYIMWPMHLQSLKLLHPTVKEETHLQEIYKMYGCTDACTYKIDVQRFLMLIFHYKFMQLTPEK